MSCVFPPIIRQTSKSYHKVGFPNLFPRSTIGLPICNEWKNVIGNTPEILTEKQSPFTMKPFGSTFLQRRFMSQKANEYILSPSEITSGLIIPVIDKDFIEANKELVQASLNARNLGSTRVNISEFLQLCEKLAECKKLVTELEKEKETNSQEHKTLREKGMSLDHPDVRSLTEKGRTLRTKSRDAEKTYNDLFNKATDIFISIPNVLHFDTPIEESQVIKTTVSKKNIEQSRSNKENLFLQDDCKSNTLRSQNQIPVFQSQSEEIQLAFKAQKILANAGYIALSTPDVIRRSIIYSMGLDNQQFHRLVSKDVKKRGPAYMSYLCGTASLPSLITLLSKSVIQSPERFPLKYTITGKSHNLKLDYEDQNCMVQCLIACTSDSSAEAQFNDLAKLMETFYLEELGLKYLETQSVAAPVLEPYEKKKFLFIANQSDDMHKIGEISLIGDHLSKRLISCYKNEKSKYVFVKYVHAVFLDVTKFLTSSV